ncbi:MAG: AAA family ATPase, partial [Actinobacteria bacterium]|nr:AAA family ATPase [Actinomycetota bacterium]
MEFRILGPLAGVGDDGAALPLGGRGDRALLATLLVQANRIVPVDMLADELWDGAPPARAAGAVQSRISRLRRAMGPAGERIVTRAPGYAAEVGPDELDAARFEAWAAEGRAALINGNVDVAAERLAAALALWRAPALCDVLVTTTLAGEAARLEEARLGALEDRIEADLACGRHQSLVGELDLLTRTHPLRERLWGHLLVALHRCDRSSEALHAFDRVRTRLGDELGLEPGPALARLVDAVRANAPELAWKPAAPRSGSGGDRPVADDGGEAAGEGAGSTEERRGGIVTILFTDTVASTSLLERLGDDEAERVRRTYFGLLREALAAHGGREVKNLGDGLMVVFSSAVSGVAAAVEMQQAIARHNRQVGPHGPELSVRVGMHVGDPIEEGGDYFGTPVVTAARLCAAASGGQILASTLVEALVAGRAGVVCKPAGGIPCRGVAQPVEAVDIVWESNRQHRLPLPEELRDAIAPPATQLAGRVDELRRLHAAWASIEDGQRAFAFVTGEPGIGKTRVVAELARLVYDDGGTVLYGRCDEGLEFTAQPFVQAMRPVMGSAPGEWLADGERSRARLFDEVDHALAQLATDAPVLLVLDDLHWADPATLRILRHLGRHADDTPVFVVGVYRDVEIDLRHPLHAVAADVHGSGRLTTVALGGLGAADVEELVCDLGARPLDDMGAALAARLHAMSGGNPTLVREMLRHLVGSGTVVIGSDGWQADGIDTIGGIDTLPAGVQEIIERRLQRLSPETNRILTLASVVGHDFDLDVVEQVSDCAPGAVLEAVEEGVAARLISESSGAFARYRFQHPLVHLTLFRRTSV